MLKMMALLQIPYLFAYALVMALVEIEIEGEHGWAEKLPTWKRTQGVAARLFGALLNGKPLTGYHAFMLPVPLFAFHLTFVQGQPWSWVAEARVMASYFVWMVEWDFLWFIFNPVYGWRRFRRGEVWWHARWIGRCPLDYVQAITFSFLLTAAGGLAVLRAHALLVAGFAVLTLAAGLCAPAYHKWYRAMRA
jgi:hypothetical protein